MNQKSEGDEQEGDARRWRRRRWRRSEGVVQVNEDSQNEVSSTDWLTRYAGWKTLTCCYWFCSLSFLFCWLIEHMNEDGVFFVGCQWMKDWLTDWLVMFFILLSSCWLIDWKVSMATCEDRLNERLTDWLCSSFFFSLVLVYWLKHAKIACVFVRWGPTDWLTDWQMCGLGRGKGKLCVLSLVIQQRD